MSATCQISSFRCQKALFVRCHEAMCQNFWLLGVTRQRDNRVSKLVVMRQCHEFLVARCHEAANLPCVASHTCHTTSHGEVMSLEDHLASRVPSCPPRPCPTPSGVSGLISLVTKQFPSPQSHYGPDVITRIIRLTVAV